MYADEDYQRRITYGTPENIKIRRFYNQLNNRPLNYGMEDLFPNVGQYTAQPMTAVNNGNLGRYLPSPSEQVRYPDLTMQQLRKVVQYENGPSSNNQTFIDNQPQIAIPYNLAMTGTDYLHYNPLAMHDKFKHAAMNCRAAQRGAWGNEIIAYLSEEKERRDVESGGNTLYESNEDMAANLIGRYLGNRYPNYDCENMLSHYISRKYPKR